MWVLPILASGIFLTEIFYRLRLYLRSRIRGEHFAYPEIDTPAPFFVVVDRASQAFHPERGYDLLPDTEFLRVGILGGKVVEAHIGGGDRNGNSGLTDAETDDTQISILVLGDSYTSLSGNGCPGSDLKGVEWPYFFKQSLAAGGIANVNVLNYACAGHGILQMADTAVSVLDAHKPDIVVFAFNTLDLSRYRYWHKTTVIGGAMRCFRMQDPDAPVDHWAEENLIDHRVTYAWAKERLERGDTDALLDDICRRHRSLRRRGGSRAIDFFSLSRLYSCDELFFDTPFMDVSAELSPRIFWWKRQDETYDGDIQFALAIRQIRLSGASIVLAHIPRVEDLVANNMVMQRHTPGLLVSLHRLTGEQVYPIGVLAPDRVIVPVRPMDRVRITRPERLELLPGAGGQVITILCRAGP